MAKNAAARTIRLRIVCLNVLEPGAANPLTFGLQDKEKRVFPGMARADGALVFECEAQVRQRDDGTPNFGGAFVHGTAQDRFLYLTWQHKANGAIERRTKITLSSITWAQVEQVGAGSVVEATVDASRSGTVPLLGDGWQVVVD